MHKKETWTLTTEGLPRGASCCSNNRQSGHLSNFSLSASQRNGLQLLHMVLVIRPFIWRPQDHPTCMCKIVRGAWNSHWCWKQADDSLDLSHGQDVGTQSELDLKSHVEYQLRHDITYQPLLSIDGQATISQANVINVMITLLFLSFCIVAGSLHFKFTVRTPHWGFGRYRNSNSSVTLITSKWIKLYLAWP